MNNQDKLIYKDPDYVQGQIESLKAMILGLARLQGPMDFREQSLRRLEFLKTALLSSPVSELRLDAVESMMAWVLSVTEQDPP